ncbi:hypothetical protein CPEBRM1_ABPJDJAI_01100 [Companilactobacillus paralimentarius]|uniref:DUF4373 domain-containing protein n=1 Tax=Companilactobacillus paralimentarius TaxID=83526 RepID=UPI003851331B
MAAPSKQGLDYFPFPVDFFDNEIIGGISGMFGIKGEIVVVKLLCTVYRKGYFAVWSDLLQSKIANDASVSKDLANQVVDRLVAWGFFNEDLYSSAKVLTSVNIQQTYLEATKRRKNRGKMPYLINEDNNNGSNEVNVNINPNSKGVNDDINTQSKVNESKVNKSNKDSHDSKPAKRVYEPDDLNLKLANYLLIKIRERNSSIYPTDSKNPPDTQKWANDIRLMHERDARSYDDIKRIIEWCQQDSFWQNNILSASKLRKQFGKLIDKADAPNNFNGNKGGRKPLYDLPY